VVAEQAGIAVVHTPHLRTETAERHLGNLLARVHGDGGHYQAEHGDDKAVSDAKERIVRERAMLDEAQAALREAFASVVKTKGSDHRWTLEHIMAIKGAALTPAITAAQEAEHD
jgi:hypothetical protein